ncbi:MAG: F0F1 ATP synthase subunit B [Coriobacteriia bacterium]
MELILSPYFTSEVIVSFVSFIVLFVALWKFALPPLTKMLDERSEKIRESLERAEEARIEAERLLDEYKEQMAEARKEASKIIDEGRKVAESMKQEIIAKANEEAEELKAKAVAAIESEKRAAMAELQASVAALSTEIAARIIGAELDESKHKALIESYLSEVGSIDE